VEFLRQLLEEGCLPEGDGVLDDVVLLWDGLQELGIVVGEQDGMRDVGIVPCAPILNGFLFASGLQTFTRHHELGHLHNPLVASVLRLFGFLGGRNPLLSLSSANEGFGGCR